MVDFWLSGSLSHELFFFHDGILAIRKPFSRTFLFSRWNSGYQEAFLTNFSFFTMLFCLSGSLSHELFFFHDGILAIRKPFSRTFLFSRLNYVNTQFGEDFFHIYITKSIYIGSASLKTLPLDLEPPLQGKEYDTPYSNATKKVKVNVFSRNHL
jgi:sulfur relay (sulfurtransferase) DsrF/TusC family protein